MRSCWLIVHIANHLVAQAGSKQRCSVLPALSRLSSISYSMGAKDEPSKIHKNTYFWTSQDIVRFNCWRGLGGKWAYQNPAKQLFAL